MIPVSNWARSLSLFTNAQADFNIIEARFRNDRIIYG